MATENFQIKINFPKCASCAARIERQISTLSGISKVAVRPPPIRVWIDYDPGSLTVNSLIRTLQGLGYNLQSERMQLKIPVRPLLPAIVWTAKVEMLTKKVAGVLAASIEFAASQITIEYLAGIVSPEGIRKALMS